MRQSQGNNYHLQQINVRENQRCNQATFNNFEATVER
jgi:hypothetical protein